VEGRLRIERIVALVVAGALLWLGGNLGFVSDWLDQRSPGERFLLPSLAFFLLYQFVHFSYETVQRRFWHREHFFGGIWIYQLFDRAVSQFVYGVFELQHTASGIRIPRAIAWNCPGEPIAGNMRGMWSSSRASVDGYQVEIVFDMKSMSGEPETGFAGYQGVLSLTVTAPGHMSGHFADLGLRRGHYGVAVAQRIPGKSFENALRDAERVYGQPAALS